MVIDSALITTANSVSSSRIALVRYAYVTIGAVIFIASALFAGAYWQDHHDKRTHNQQMPLTQQTTHKEDDTETSAKKPAERQCREK